MSHRNIGEISEVRLLFDHNVPSPLRYLLPQHDVVTAGELGRGGLTNGELLASAELAGFEVFLTSDKNLVYQQSIAGRHIAIVVLPTQRLQVLRDGLDQLHSAIERATNGAFVAFELPRPPLRRRPGPGAPISS